MNSIGAHSFIKNSIAFLISISEFRFPPQTPFLE